MIEQAYALIANDKNEILLVQESDDSWSLPGGAREESDKDMGVALQRELEEELGLTKNTYSVIPTDISVSFVYDERSKSRRGQNARIDLFIVTLHEDAQIKPDNEINDIGWHSIGDGTKMMRFDEHRELIQRGDEFMQSGGQGE